MKRLGESYGIGSGFCGLGLVGVLGVFSVVSVVSVVAPVTTISPSPNISQRMFNSGKASWILPITSLLTFLFLPLSICESVGRGIPALSANSEKGRLVNSMNRRKRVAKSMIVSV